MYAVKNKYFKQNKYIFILFVYKKKFIFVFNYFSYLFILKGLLIQHRKYKEFVYQDISEKTNKCDHILSEKLKDIN